MNLKYAFLARPLPLGAPRSPLTGRGGLPYLPAMAVAGSFMFYHVVRLTKRQFWPAAWFTLPLFLPVVLGLMIACKAGA